MTVRRPAVLVVMEQPWHSLLQLSAALRRHGVAVVLVGRVRGRDERVMARLLFTEVCEPTALGALAERYDVVDVQGRDEDVVELMTLYGKRLGEPVRSLVARSAHQADKVRMAEVLGRGDVPVPRHLVAPVHSTTVVRDIGLPVVVKTRVGAGGQGVTRVDTERDLARMLAAGDGSACFVEEFLTGETYQYAAAYGHGRVLLDVTFRTVQRSGGGPADRCEVVQEPAVLRTGRRVVELLEGRGLVNLDMVLAPDGPRVVDVNVRTWDSMVPMRRSGLDFVSSYLRALGVPAGPFRPAAGPSRVESFPGPILAAMDRPDAERRRLAPLLLSTAWTGRRYLRWLGPRYAAHVTWLIVVAHRAQSRS